MWVESGSEGPCASATCVQGAEQILEFLHISGTISTRMGWSLISITVPPTALRQPAFKVAHLAAGGSRSERVTVLSMFHTVDSRSHAILYFMGISESKHGQSKAKHGISSTYCDIKAQTWTEKAGYINIRWKHRVG